MRGDVFFILRLVEEGEEKDGDDCYALDIQEFVRRGMLVFSMGSSRKVNLRDEARLLGRIVRALAFA